MTDNPISPLDRRKACGRRRQRTGHGHRAIASLAAAGVVATLIAAAPSAAAVTPAAAAASDTTAAHAPTATLRTAGPTLPSTAVAMGDSFISGEGAGDYQPVVGLDGVAHGFPGWTAPNSNPYFCHRSANASIQVASLPGITDRVNIACSGGQPHDMAAPSATRPKGRDIASQISQLRAVAATHDIDVVLIGLGSNNSQFTFGNVAADCAGRFVADGYTGWWEVWIHFINWISGSEVSERPCSMGDLATPAQLQAATAETIAAVRQILVALDEVDADGQHTVVLQDYTNPLPLDYAAPYLTEAGRSDTRDKFRALVDERYAAGCPAHRASLAPAHQFSQALGTIVQTTATTLAAERPQDRLVYLDVQHAFDGARLCENPGSPANSLARPLRLKDDPNGPFVTDFGPFDKLDIKRLTKTCESYFQTCQESWHPNVAGHQVLGQCLTQALAISAAQQSRPARMPTATPVLCQRHSDGTITATPDSPGTSGPTRTAGPPPPGAPRR